MRSENFYRPDIDGLRALAVCLVLCYHAFPHDFKSGFVGVDVFFVISGYLIGGIILRGLSAGSFSLLHFYSRRILRIFPALLLMLPVVLLAGHFLLFPDEYQALGKHTLGGSAFVANLVYWSEIGYWDVSATLKPLLHLWSLGVEEQFYIISPLLLIFAWKRQYNLLVLSIVLMLASLASNFYFFRRSPSLDFYAPFTRFWEIFSGIVLAALPGHAARLRPAWLKFDHGVARVLRRDVESADGTCASNLLAVLGLACLVAALLVCRVNRYFPGYSALWPVCGAVLIIAAGQRSWLNRRIFSHKLAVGVGLISYPLYLWHWPLLSYATILGGEGAGLWKWRFIRLICVLIALLLAILTYFLVERPIRFGKGGIKLKVLVMLILMTCIGSTGFYVFKKDIPDEPVSIAKKQYNALIMGVAEDGSLLKYDPELDTLSFAHYQDAGSEKTVAVIGDSHAYAAFPGIAEKNKSLGLNTVCIPFRFDQYQAQEERKRVINILKSKKDITHIFVFMRGVVNLNGRDVDAKKWSKSGDKFKPLLQNFVDEMNGTGKYVYIVSENPVFPQNIEPRNFIRRPLFALNSFTEYPQMLRKDVYQHQKEYLDLLKEIKGAEIINGLDVFCPNGKCIMFDADEMPLYSDDDHLSVNGSRYLVKNLLEPYLLEIAGQEKE
ncbi:MAG: acyltransferase [Desulfovibrionaceae bacterium]|nr:acyltransferase [Desulfovibrionaceae bacterium]